MESLPKAKHTNENVTIYKVWHFIADSKWSVYNYV